jgi:hypothetical protein
MGNEIIRFERRFKIWLYTVSHGQLLLRSTKDQQYGTQIDVLFKNVAAISMPVLFDGLSICEVDKGRVRSLNSSVGALSYDGRKSFLLSGPSWEGFVIAGALVWHEEDAEHSSESKLLARLV